MFIYNGDIFTYGRCMFTTFNRVPIPINFVFFGAYITPEKGTKNCLLAILEPFSRYWGAHKNLIFLGLSQNHPIQRFH